ncbi:MAG: hypothetical protein M3376_08225 [Actinomycetota bacterium]|nr:hypothetical protein [Actinomycetota bacterium]
MKRWTAKAVDRRAVREGAWQGATGSGSQLRFRVTGGGRAISAVKGTVPNNCTSSSTFEGPTTGAIVAPDGTFRVPLTLAPGYFGGQFTGATSVT